MTAAAALVVEGATRRRRATLVLDGVSLAIAPGEILGLLGPNGAGKTSLIRAITGRLRLDSGTVRVANGGTTSVGIVPQGSALYPRLTARENLEILGRLAGLSAPTARTRAIEALRWVGLEDRANHIASTLSGGMQRRLNIAAGVLHEPRLVLLDEPTAGVDAGAREDVHRLLRALRDRGTALLLATHDLDEAHHLSDRVAILVQGAVRAIDAPRALVARLFGANREVVVTTDAALEERGRRALGALGLSADRGGVVWSGPLAGEMEESGRVVEALRAAGVEVRELKVREADLRSVYRRLVGTEFEAA